LAALAGVLSLSTGEASAAESNASWLKNVHSGLCMDVPGASMIAGVRLHQWTCVNQSNEKWKLRRYGSFSVQGRSYPVVMIANTHSGLCVNDYAQGAYQVVQWGCTNANANKWIVIPRGGSQFQFMSRSNLNICLAVDGQGVGAWITMRTCQGTDHHEQSWDFRGGIPN
jgi:hypothetical protein